MPGAVNPEDTAEDTQDGSYTIELHVHPDGTFTVDDQPDVYDTLEDALKAVLAAYRSHAPTGATPHEQMAAGYGPPDVTR